MESVGSVTVRTVRTVGTDQPGPLRHLTGAASGQTDHHVSAGHRFERDRSAEPGGACED